MKHKLGALIGMAVDQNSLPALGDAVPDQIAPPVVSDYRVDGNDKLGDCTIAGADHCTAAWNVIYSLDLPRLSDSQLEQTYFRLGHNQDLGLPEQTVVAAWKRESAPTWFGYQLTGGAQVANSSIKQVIATKGVAYLGVALPSVAEQQFADEQPWSVVPGATIAGGHCVVGVGYDSQYLTVVTWGKTQKVTWDWWQTYGFECWSLTVPKIHKVN